MTTNEKLEKYIEKYTKMRRKLRELILDEDNELVSEEELRRRLEDKYGVVAETNDEEEIRFVDPSIKGTKNETSIIVEKDIPVSRAIFCIHTRKHPDELPPVETEAEKQIKFNEMVNKKIGIDKDEKQS